uniref:U11/U12 small nuclear ribonucleoprotein 35 kDa protein n=1 Tax=Strigamia maritima TaxID=126957 RepID=T1ITE6_STRMM
MVEEMSDWTPIAREYDPLKAGSIDGTDTRPHDSGIERAMLASYHTNKKVTGDPECTLFVARLNPKTNDSALRKAFSQFGEVKRTRLIEDLVTGFSKCYAFVEFEDERSAQRGYKDGNKMFIDGNEIFVDYECERTLRGWIPRRLGGGFGGRKESGQLRFGGRDRPFRKPIVLPKGGGDFRRKFNDDKSYFDKNKRFRTNDGGYDRRRY